MRDLREILSARFLPRVRQPSQYVGLEHNARGVDPRAADLSVALCYPEAYTIGISHLGSQILYHALNDLPGIACDRAYCPLPDAEAVLRDENIPLFSWESRLALGDFDVLGFSLGYELCISNVLTMLNLAGVPLEATRRGPEDPLVIGGDALADSPEAVAMFFDVFLPGEGEEPLCSLARFLQGRDRSDDRAALLRDIARTVPGAYVPSLYEPDACGRVEPTAREAPPVIARACHEGFSTDAAETLAGRQLVPLAEGVHERVMIEVMRGCPNACRFCQAGFARLPVRYRPPEDILAAAERGIDATGFDEISLLSLSTSDYPDLEGLIGALNERFADRRVSVSLPSLRADSQLRVLPKLTSTVRKGGLTIAAEAGSQRLRRAINKRITEEDMLEGVRAAWSAGWRSVKVYFMAGLPGETFTDIDEMFHLCRRISNIRREVDGHRGAVNASVSWFVPKPHTPLQWAGMARPEYFFDVMHRLRDLARRTPVQFKFHRIERSILEALLCRGDRSVGRTVLAAWRAGARMDGWNEHWNWELWQQAIEETGVDLDTVVHADRLPSDPLPWNHIRCRPRPEALRVQWRRMQSELNTP